MRVSWVQIRLAWRPRICSPEYRLADWQVQLWEDDAPDPDDFLGEHLVTLGAAGGGVQTAEFRLDGASYDLQYEVMDIEGTDTAEAGDSQRPRRVE